MSSNRKTAIISNIWLFVIGVPSTIYGIIVTALAIVGNNNLLSTISILIIGIILLTVGITIVLKYRYNRKRVLGTLQTYERVSLEQLSLELKLEEKQVKDLVIDLRAEGKIKASFEPESGDVLIFEVNGEPVIAIVPMSSSDLPEHEEKYKDKRIPQEHNYCSFCGSIIHSNDKFCNNCGSLIE